MSASRFLLVSLIVAAGVSSAAAQLPASNQDSLVPTQLASATDYSSAGDSSLNIRIDQFRVSPQARSEFAFFSSDNASPSKSEVAFGMPYRLHVKNLEDQESDTVCYSMRSYRVVRDDPQSDTTRATGYSTCQPATRYKVKTAVETSGDHALSIRY